MEIYPLLYFQTIAETGNLTRAAEKLMISPPALSNSLKRLEQDLGVELFDRVGRSLVLNRYGEAYLPYVRQILTLTRQSSELMTQMKEEQQKHLSIADTTYVFASHLISAFLEQHGVALAAVSMPIPEVGITAVADEVAAPDGFYFPDNFF